jgi:hypothetical protein
LDGWLDEVMYEHARRGLSTSRPESIEGVDRLIAMSEDVMKFKVIEFLLELSYLLAVCHHEGVMAIRLPHDLVDDELKVTTNVKPLDPELIGDA